MKYNLLLLGIMLLCRSSSAGYDDYGGHWGRDAHIDWCRDDDDD